MIWAIVLTLVGGLIVVNYVISDVCLKCGSRLTRTRYGLMTEHREVPCLVRCYNCGHNSERVITFRG